MALDLSPRQRQDHAARQQDRVARLMAATLATSPDAWRDVAADMIADDCTVTDLIDVYIPAVARRLGEDWVADRAGFAQVTLGCARLGPLLVWADGMLDDLDLSPAMSHGKIYLTSPEGGQHRLGQQVFAVQLLRRGVTVEILSPSSTVNDADVVMISASGQETLCLLKSSVRRARGLGKARS